MALSKEYHKLLLISPPRTLGRHLKLKQCQIQTFDKTGGGGGGAWSPKNFWGSKNKGVPWPPLGPSLESATVKCNLFYEYHSCTVEIVEIHLSLEWFHKSRDCFFIDKNKLHCGC